MTTQRNAKGEFLRGNGGRPVGARNKLNAAFIHDLQEHWAENGKSAIEIVFKEDPATYCKIVAALQPKEFRVDGKPLSDQLQSMSDQELADAVEYVRAHVRNGRPKPPEIENKR